MRPDTLKDIVGQDKAKQVAQILIKAAKKKGGVLPHIASSGSAGTGKTTLALAIANEMGSKLHISNGSIIRNIKDLKRYLDEIKEGDILFIDEIHRLPIRVCESLYTILEDFRYEYIDKEKAYSVELPQFTMMGATTHIGTLPDPLRQRLKFILEFEKYTLEELTEISSRVAKENGFALQKNTAKKIAMTCRGNPRMTVNRTEWIRDYLIASDDKSLTGEELSNVIKMQGFDEDGLRSQDYRYLEILKKHGPISLESVANKLCMDIVTVKEDIEPYLVEMNKIDIGKKGRSLV